MSPVRFLVTGGAGFIGSHVVDELLDAGADVVVIDSLDPAAHGGREPDYLDSRAEYVRGDLRELDLTPLLEGVDGISHQASKVGLGVDFGDVGEYVTHNDLGTARLLEAMHHTGWGGRVSLASSMVVYGEGRYECREHGVVAPGPRPAVALERAEWEPPCPHCGAALSPAPVGEDTPLDPRNVYAATKLHQEHLMNAFANEHSGVRVTSLRYHNVYGPRMPRDTPYSGVAAIFRSSLENGEPPRVFEDGGQRRDFVHVRDVAHANVLALTAPEPVPGAFNIGSGDPHTVGEMAAELARAAGGPEPVVTGDFRLGDVRHVFASIDRARSRLGYEPAVSFGDGMAEFSRAPLRASVGNR